MSRSVSISCDAPLDERPVVSGQCAGSSVIGVEPWRSNQVVSSSPAAILRAMTISKARSPSCSGGGSRVLEVLVERGRRAGSSASRAPPAARSSRSRRLGFASRRHRARRASARSRRRRPAAGCSATALRQRVEPSREVERVRFGERELLQAWCRRTRRSLPRRRPLTRASSSTRRCPCCGRPASSRSTPSSC